ncbi:hypothetical protein ACE2AJ_14335 [Aquihabitans daechungensis]|uniref:hypothetical protein n=1 Tax=Aquihabitans daechungensis TaxID=1052257 RepID=UPI003BA3A74E
MSAEADLPLHGPALPERLLHRAAEELAEVFGVERQLDKLLYQSAQEVGGVEFASIFNPIPTERLTAKPRPDAINHDQAFLRSNPLSSQDTQDALGLLEILHGPHAGANADVFAAFAEREKFFERLADGQSFIFVGSHLEFQDVGFNLGYLTRAAHLHGFDRLDTRTTLMIGRLLGYLEVMGLNVIDDILRKAANVLKTFPVSGGEAVNEGDITDEDLNRRVRNFRKRQNARTREEFMNLMTSDHGHLVIEAGSGSRDAKDEHGYIVMEPFAAGTREDLYLAVQAGASIYPIFGDYGNTEEPSVVEIGKEITTLSSPQHAHSIGEVIASMGNRARGGAAREHPEIARFRTPIRYGNYEIAKD